MSRRDELSGVDLILFDEIREVRGDVKCIDRRLAKMEVKSGLIGALAGATIFALTKVKMFFGGS
jgi:hypothetical protein